VGLLAQTGSFGDRSQDSARTARLLLDAELTAGTLTPAALDTETVRKLARVRAVPPRPLRLAQQVLYKLKALDFESAVVRPSIAARRAALGERGAAEPRFLIRVDEFPHYKAWDEPERFGVPVFERFHEILTAAGVPYMLAVLPRVSHEPLSPAAAGSRALDETEVAMLGRVAREGVTLALHGRDHRTRHASSRRHSELCGLSLADTAALLDDALAELARHAIAPDAFVPPYNRFDARQLGLLAERFAIVCGGPESIGQMGFQRTPQWRDEAVYLPAYAPLYGRAAEMLPAVERAIEQKAGLWMPAVLHWGWEADAGWRDLERLADRIAPYAVSWNDFHAALARSRAEEESPPPREHSPPSAVGRRPARAGDARDETAAGR
jgi:peptidoglycan/xylan/chitin deacetylase (PgdA/CDA1 family)